MSRPSLTRSTRSPGGSSDCRRHHQGDMLLLSSGLALAFIRRHAFFRACSRASGVLTSTFAFVRAAVTSSIFSSRLAIFVLRLLERVDLEPQALLDALEPVLVIEDLPGLHGRREDVGDAVRP